MACVIAQAIEQCTMTTEECQIPELEDQYGPAAIENLLAELHQQFVANATEAPLAGSSWNDCPEVPNEMKSTQ